MEAKVEGDLADIVWAGGCGVPGSFLRSVDDVAAIEQASDDRLRGVSGKSKAAAAPAAPGAKRRKGVAKRVICIPAPSSSSGDHQADHHQISSSSNKSSSSGVVVPSDLWAWRKYGQKPIKGSPYPRGYYRCSSSKGCSARKQVERSPSDPNMLVITYTSEHNHPWPTHKNSLAGSTRPPHHPPKTTTLSSSSPSSTTSKPSPPSSKPPAVDPDHDTQLNIYSTMINEEDVDVFDVDTLMAPVLTTTSKDTEYFSFDECLGGLEPDPMSFFFSSSSSSRDHHFKFEGDNKGLDALTYFDWDGN